MGWTSDVTFGGRKLAFINPQLDINIFSLRWTEQLSIINNALGSLLLSYNFPEQKEQISDGAKKKICTVNASILWLVHNRQIIHLSVCKATLPGYFPNKQ